MNRKEKRVIMLLNAAIVIAAAALIVNLFWSVNEESSSGPAGSKAAAEETEESGKSEAGSASDQESTEETSTENDSRVKTQEEIEELMESRSSKLFPDINQRYLENEEAEMLKTYEQVQYAIDELYALNGRTFVENHSVIKKYFTKQSDGKYYKTWYDGGTSAEIDREDFNQYGQKNLDLLVSRREELSD